MYWYCKEKLNFDQTLFGKTINWKANSSEYMHIHSLWGCFCRLFLSSRFRRHCSCNQFILRWWNVEDSTPKIPYILTRGNTYLFLRRGRERGDWELWRSVSVWWKLEKRELLFTAQFARVGICVFITIFILTLRYFKQKAEKENKRKKKTRDSDDETSEKATNFGMFPPLLRSLFAILFTRLPFCLLFSIFNLF